MRMSKTEVLMNSKFLIKSIAFCFLLTCGISAEARPYHGKAFCAAKRSSNEKAIKLESIIQAAPWDETEPFPLPKNWKKHKAKQNIIVYYLGVKVYIPKGDTYFTYKGKVAIGWHGSYNPPRGM